MLTRTGLLIALVAALALTGCGRRGPLEPPPGVVEQKPVKKAAVPPSPDSTAPQGLFRNTTNQTTDPTTGAAQTEKPRARATGPFVLDPLLQ